MSVICRGRVCFTVLWLSVCTLLPGGAGGREITPDEKVVWSTYMICWAVNRDYHGFYDRPLDRPAVDGTSPRLIDLRRAVEAGIDALSVDLFIGDKYALPAFGDLVKLINENHLSIQLSPMFDGLADPGLTLDDTVAKIEQWFKRFGNEPCVARTGGKPIVFTFNANSLSPDQWKTVWRRLDAAECRGYWVAELSHYLSVGDAPNFVAAKPWLDLFPAANAFNVHSAARAEATFRGFAGLYPDSRVWVAPVCTGYWRPEIAVYTSQHGTSLFRATWQAVCDSRTRWVQQSTWNDFGENHQIMPSENFGTAFVELNRYLAAQWKGRPTCVAGPRLHLSQQQEVQVGEHAEWELLALLPDAAAPARFRLRIMDGVGQCIHAFPESPALATGLNIVSVELPIETVPAGRLLVPEAALVDAQGKELAAIHGPYSIVNPAGYRPERNYSWLHTIAPAAAGSLTCALKLDTRRSSADATAPDVTIEVDADGPLADVEILHDGRQVLSLRRDCPKVTLATPLTWRGQLSRNRLGQLPWGVYSARAVARNGSMATSLPVFVERPPEASVTLGHWTFDADSAQDILDSSPWLHDGRLGGRPRRKPWFPTYAADPWGGRCLQFDGVDDRVMLEGAIVPPQQFTVECWFKPVGNASAGGQILFATANAAVVLAIDRTGHLQATRKCGGRWRGVADRQPVTYDRWQHAAVVCNGESLRLYVNGQMVAEQEAKGDAQCGQVAIGYNSVTNQGFYSGLLDELRLSARPLSPEEFGPHNPLRKSVTQ